MSKYSDVLKRLGHLYLEDRLIKEIEDDEDGSYEWYVPYTMLRQKSHPVEVNVVYNDYDLSDPDNYMFVFIFENKLYGFDYFMNSDSAPEANEDSFKEVVAKNIMVTVYE